MHVGIVQLAGVRHTTVRRTSVEGSGAPLGTGLQTPMEPGSAQEVHSPKQAVLQQTPWAQNPLLHSLLAVQMRARDAPHVPLRQRTPPAQSSSLAQVVLQRPRATSQANGAQLTPSGPHG